MGRCDVTLMKDARDFAVPGNSRFQNRLLAQPAGTASVRVKLRVGEAGIKLTSDNFPSRNGMRRSERHCHPSTLKPEPPPIYSRTNCGPEGIFIPAETSVLNGTTG